MTHIAVTGASGFVGHALVRTLIAQGYETSALVRSDGTAPAQARAWRIDATHAARWPDALRPDAVVHLAARVHVIEDDAPDALAAFRDTNVNGALIAARAAREAGARRFVFVSSIKALAQCDAGRPLNETDTPAPPDPYGVSKREAEVVLSEYGAATGIEVVIVRPPLVYGPQVRANFLALMRAIARGVPLPLGAIGARRSLVFNDNLADALALCATHPHAPGELFHVTDGDDPSVAELARSLGRHLGRPARLAPVPPMLLRVAGRMTGKAPQVERLIGSLRVDSSKIRTVLGWQPRFTLDAGLEATARWYRASTSQSN